MENNKRELDVQLSYLKSDLKNVIAKKQALDKMKDKCYEWIDDINTEMEDVNKKHLEIIKKMGKIKWTIKEMEEKESKWNSIPVLCSIEDINKIKLNKKKRKIYIEAIIRTTKIVDSNPDYYGEHVDIVLDTVIIEMGYNPKDIKGIE